MLLSVRIRDENAADCRAIRDLNDAAFGGTVEGAIVDRLREAGLLLVSLVAEDDAGLAGHILFSRIFVHTACGVSEAVALGPMGVRPDRQRQGVGSLLVQEGLARCKSMGESAVIVVGHPGYYPRFGFSAEAALGLDGPFSGAAWMALELAPGALRTLRGAVKYPPEWGLESAPL